MRVLVTTTAFAGLTSAQTGAALARAWAELGDQLAVVGMGEAGKGFTRAWAELTGAVDGDWHGGGVVTGPAGLAIRAESTNLPQPHDAASSEHVGVQLAAALVWAEAQGRPHHEVWIEAEGGTWTDGGQGFWRALADVRDQLADIALHLVTTSEQAQLHLTGFRGITAVNGRANGMHPGDMLAADEALVDWCASIGRPELGTTAGSGAAGGLGASVLALGGDVVTGPAECVRLAGLEQTIAACDLVVAGYDLLDFGSKGGDVLPLVAEIAQAQGRPVVAVARHDWISAREIRTMGIEQGYSLCRLAPEGSETGDGGVEVADEATLTEACRAVARTWHW